MTTTDPGQKAPTQAQLDEDMRNYARSLGVAADAIEGFVTAWRRGLTGLDTARRELLWRLNERLQGRDPGQPTHWRGL